MLRFSKSMSRHSSASTSSARRPVHCATTTIVLVLFFSGIQLLFLGILGEYIGAIHGQVRRKPFIVIRERINFPGSSRQGGKA